MELNRDGDGFLINTSDWSEEVMYEMAKSDDMEMTDEIKMYIDKARQMYGHFAYALIINAKRHFLCTNRP